MLPTKGYFQDIECPYFNSSCGRPYCHFRHRKKQSEHAEDIVTESEKSNAAVPTYKPTPKSELANIHNRSHIPISYVPDLSFRHDKKLRSTINPTYNPTPISILSSANKGHSLTENKAELDVINEIKQNIASVEYDPTISLQEDIDFEDLSNEFELIDEIISADEKNSKLQESSVNNDSVNTDSATERKVLSEKIIKTEKNTNKHCDKSKKTETVNVSASSSKNSKKDKVRSVSSKKESSSNKKSDKTHKSKDKRSSSSSSSTLKSKDKDRSKDDTKKSTTTTKDKKVHTNKNKEKDKIKQSAKSSKESESKNKRRDSSDHKKTKEKEKTSKNKEHKSSKSNEKSSKSDDKKRKDKDKYKNREKPKPEKVEVDLFEDDNNINFDSDIDVDEDETMLECYRIFNEYNPTLKAEKNSEEKMETMEDIKEHHGKKRVAHSNIENPSKYSYTKPKEVQTPGQTLTDRYKTAKLAQANREQELLINEVHNMKRSTPPTLLEAARERKRVKEMEKKPKPSNLIDDILKGTTMSSIPKKIAPARNVLALAKAKEKISKIKPVVVTKTIAQTQKGTRVAHIPDISLSDIPDVLQADKSKLPVNVRTRFLTMIADECVKLYISKNEAYSRALKEEFNCYEKCKVLTSYRNSAMLAVNRLRKEIQERDKSGLGLIGIGEDTGEGSGLDSKGLQFYNQVQKWLLTEEELDIHGYPRQTEEYGVAVVKNFKSRLPTNLDDNQRICSRCRKLYQVDDDGWPLFEEECNYHPLKKRTIRGEQTYLCCRSSDEMGCATSDCHVFDGFTSGTLEGFQCTMDTDDDFDPRNHAVYALDCEMCYTTKGLELTRVTIIDIDCKTVYESFVKPLNPIIDYNTKFSGITKEQMDRTSTSILQIQANILHLCNSRTILVGHSLESDMKALKIVHGNVIDTSVLFPHKMGLPHKRALRALASEFLRKIIQNDVSGHDSAEDAVTCMELLKWKLKEESKRRTK